MPAGGVSFFGQLHSCLATILLCAELLQSAVTVKTSVLMLREVAASSLYPKALALELKGKQIVVKMRYSGGLHFLAEALFPATGL